ncbi:MAG: hypothetical protein HY671_10805 [Chloroflexi bacterium]|nr:hypothetical protein [Chloroflexota bacterium]
MNRQLEQVLALCLEDISRGARVEDCLARYPHLAGELEPLLRTAIGVQSVTHVAMRPEFRAAARRRVLASLRSGIIQPQRRRRMIGWQWRWATGLAALVVVLVGWGTIGLANNSLPDETLYPVKIVTEEVKLALTPGTVRKAHLQADIIDERTREIAELTRLQRAAQIQRASQQLNRQLDRLGAMAASPGVTAGRSLDELETLLEEKASHQLEALEKAINRAPESAKPALRQTQQRVQAKYQETKQQLTEKRASAVIPDGKSPDAKAAPTKAVPKPPSRTPPPAPSVTPRVATPTPTRPAVKPTPKPPVLLKTDDGLATVDCQVCSLQEIQQYLAQAHSQAKLEGVAFNAVVIYSYSYVDGKPVRQRAKKLFRIAEMADGSIRIEWECGPCDAVTLQSLGRRVEGAFSSAMALASPSRKPALFFTVSPDARRFNATPYSGKQQLAAKRPEMTAAYPWPLDNPQGFVHQTTLVFASAMRYTREDFIGEWLAATMSRGLGNEQYEARLRELKSGTAYSTDVDTFGKARLATDMMVALRAEGITGEKVTLLLQKIEGRNVNWAQFKLASRQIAGKNPTTLNAMDKGVGLWRSWSVAHK